VTSWSQFALSWGLVETKHIISFIVHLVNSTAHRTVGVNKGSFLASAFRELSVALVRSQGRVYRSCAKLVARASGRQLVAGEKFRSVISCLVL
jgi:hypothetical protein